MTLRACPSTRSTLGLVLLAASALLPGMAPATGATSDPSEAPGVAAAASRIDALVEEALARHGQAVEAAVVDTVFLRRAYVDIAGRIPTAGEARAFLDDPAPGKRNRLIDTLLDGPGYAARMFLWYADLFRLRTKLAKRTSGEPFAHWIKQAIADDMPYDTLVHELLAATGPAHAEGSGATGYLLRDRGMPEDSMSNTARLFLGMRIECAQCHDHPFNEWTQRQYFEMVAFSGGVDYEIDFGGVDHGPRLLELRAEVKQTLGKPGNKAFERMLRPLSTGLEGTGTAAVRLPDDYRSQAGGAPGDWIRARTLFGDAIGPEPEFPEPPRGNAKRSRRARDKTRPPLPVGSREVFADWVTSSENPTFTTVIANRMWKRVMGHGLVEPVDSLDLGPDPVHPELLAELESLMRALDYDLREFQRVLHHTAAWQRRAPTVDLGWDAPASLGAPPVHRMQAEQIWDSLLTLVVEDVDGTLAPPRDAYAAGVYASYSELASAPADELLDEVRFRALKFSDPAAYRVAQKARKQEQQADRKAERQADQRALRPLKNALRKAKRRDDTAAIETLQDQLTDTASDADAMDERRPKKKRPADGLVRAADLPSPAPADHFLRAFGQSDREQIDAGHVEPNVPQVLSLLNGFLETHLLTNPDAVLGQELEAAPHTDARIETAFLALLARRPTADELRLWRGEIGSRGRQALKDLVWTLANTHEFLFVR